MQTCKEKKLNNSKWTTLCVIGILTILCTLNPQIKGLVEIKEVMEINEMVRKIEIYSKKDAQM